MLRLKILRGPSTGEVIDLKEGENTVGRLPECNVVINSPGVSKKHAKITVNGESAAVTDLGSSNGVFVNGIKVANRIVKVGDRIAFHDVIVEIVSGALMATQGIPASPWQTNLAYKPQHAPLEQSMPQQNPKTLGDFATAYVNSVVLPGLYQINVHYSLKTILACFIGIFILLVTTLSSIPMAQLTKEGVQKEAQRRAYTIAKQLASISERAINSGGESTISTDFATSEDGVNLALVVSKEDGHIIAPATLSQTYSNDEFVARARKNDEVYIDQISDSVIGVSIPIKSFSRETGTQNTVAFAQVLYKMNSIDLNATVGVFARVLIIATLLGGIIFFLLYRVIVHPIEDAGRQLDLALRGEKDSVTSPYDFDIFKKFLSDVNTAISRMGSTNRSGTQIQLDRTSEYSNLVRIVSDPAFALDPNLLFLQVNSAFEDLIGMRLLTLQGQGLDILQDQALKLNIEDLIQKSKIQPGSIITSDLEIGGINFEIDVQASQENNGLNYFFGTLKKRSEG